MIDRDNSEKKLSQLTEAIACVGGTEDLGVIPGGYNYAGNVSILSGILLSYQVVKILLAIIGS